MTILYAIVESPLHPNLGSLYRRLGITEHKFGSVRKAIQALKQQPPELVVADFIYGYGNNYAGVNISNLDVFLYSLQKYAPHAKVVVLVEKSERRHAAKLAELFTLHGLLEYPIEEDDLAGLLRDDSTSGT